MMPLESMAAVTAVAAEEERRRRRKISNRDSARRSRIKKQRRMEELRAEVEKLASQNREQAARLAVAAQRCMLFHGENERLRLEQALLSRKLSDLRRLLIVRQLRQLAVPFSAAACTGFAAGNEPSWASLIA